MPMKSETCICRPACMSCFCVLSIAPIGVSRAISFAICDANGRTKRSMNGACISISSSVRRRPWVTASMRSMIGSRRAGIEAPKTASNTPRNARAPAIPGIRFFSPSGMYGPLDLDIDDAADDEEAGEDHHDATAQHRPSTPDGLLEDTEHVGRVDDGEQQRQHDWQQGDHIPGELLLRGEHTHLADQFDALANGMRNRLHDLDQIAAHLALHVDRGDEQLQILRLHALDEVGKRLLWREAEADLAHHAVEFVADWLRPLARHQLHRLQEAVAGT